MAPINFSVSIQWATHLDRQELPSSTQIRHWAKQALKKRVRAGELCIRVVDDPEIQELNRVYRQKNQPTNVLSFEEIQDDQESTPENQRPFLGDIVISAETVYREALHATRPFHTHFAHMVVHGCLHLLGMDHIQPDEAQIMESEEVQVLSVLGFPNPYLPPSTDEI